MFSGGNDLAIYTFLTRVEYQVRAHFEWNLNRPELEADRVSGKHFGIAKRMVERGGRQDIFLGTRDCQAYVEHCEFGSGSGHYDEGGELSFGVMFHGFDYPDETGGTELHTRFCRVTMVNGVIEFERPEECKMREFVREMSAKPFGIGKTMNDVESEALAWGVE